MQRFPPHILHRFPFGRAWNALRATASKATWNKHLTIIILCLMTIGLLGLVGVQAHWLLHTAELNEQLFRASVHRALMSVVQRLEANETKFSIARSILATQQSTPFTGSSSNQNTRRKPAQQALEQQRNQHAQSRSSAPATSITVSSSLATTTRTYHARTPKATPQRAQRLAQMAHDDSDLSADSSQFQRHFLTTTTKPSSRLPSSTRKSTSASTSLDGVVSIDINNAIGAAFGALRSALNESGTPVAPNVPALPPLPVITIEHGGQRINVAIPDLGATITDSVVMKLRDRINSIKSMEQSEIMSREQIRKLERARQKQAYEIRDLMDITTREMAHNDAARRSLERLRLAHLERLKSLKRLSTPPTLPADEQRSDKHHSDKHTGIRRTPSSPSDPHTAEREEPSYKFFYKQHRFPVLESYQQSIRELRQLQRSLQLPQQGQSIAFHIEALNQQALSPAEVAEQADSKHPQQSITEHSPTTPAATKKNREVMSSSSHSSTGGGLHRTQLRDTITTITNKVDLVEKVLLDMTRRRQHITERVSADDIEQQLATALVENNISQPFAFAVQQEQSPNNRQEIAFWSYSRNYAPTAIQDSLFEMRTVAAKPLTASQDKALRKQDIQGRLSQHFQQSDFKVRLFPHDLGEDSWQLVLYFPERRAASLATFTPVLAASAAFMALIIGCFGFTLVSLMKQKKLSDMKTDFINNMTHELKTPIATIAIASEALKDEAVRANTSRVERFVSIIHDENKRLAGHVEKVLNAAQMERGELRLALSNINVHDLINRTVESFALQIEQCSGRITLDLQAERSTLLADEIHFTNVIANLLDNALKYSAADRAPHIHIATSSTARTLHISIHDNGIGMNKESQNHIFEKFYRVSTGNVHNVKGFGLGLSYVQSIIAAHSGKIAVQSELGKGSIFTLSLPFVE
jgi:signal transduction histidine kinase